VRPTASAELRTKLAEALADRLSRLDAKDPIREFLLASDPLNCGAQVVLYTNSTTTKDVKTKLEQQFVAYSGLALARLLEIPEAAVSGAMGGGVVGAPAGKIDPDLAPRLSGLLWSPKFCGLVSRL